MWLIVSCGWEVGAAFLLPHNPYCTSTQNNVGATELVSILSAIFQTGDLRTRRITSENQRDGCQILGSLCFLMPYVGVPPF